MECGMILDEKIEWRFVVVFDDDLARDADGCGGRSEARHGDGVIECVPLPSEAVSRRDRERRGRDAQTVALARPEEHAVREERHLRSEAILREMIDLQFTHASIYPLAAALSIRGAGVRARPVNRTRLSADRR